MQHRMSVAAAALLAGVFAFFHGAAHGVELAGLEQLSALAGMVFASTS
ncbi:hydrogenase/urease accessory protein HupE [Bradyrhizobium yuanmingense]